MAANIQWELLLDLMAHLLEPKTLALALCVSKSWHCILSQDHHWQPHCLSHFPSLFSYMHHSPNSNISPRHLFSLVQSSSSFRRRRRPCKPRIAVSDLIFTVDVFRGANLAVCVAVSGDDKIVSGCGGVFRYLLGLQTDVKLRDGEEMRVVWRVLVKGGRSGAMAMMDVVGKARVVRGGYEVWFQEELPGPACCCREGKGVVAELGFGLDVKRRVVERVDLGLMSGVECRYLSVDDGLLYLQGFLLPSHDV